MPKAMAPKAERPARRHNPLENDILATGLLRNKPTKSKSKTSAEADESFIDSKASKNILRIGRQLAEEESAESASLVPEPIVDSFGYDVRFDDGQAAEETHAHEEDEAWDDDDDVVEEIEVDPEDLDMYKKFLPDEDDDLLKHGWDLKPSGDAQGDNESRNLADIIMQKIAAHEASEARKDAGVPEDDYEMPPKVVEVYTKCVPLLPDDRGSF